MSAILGDKRTHLRDDADEAGAGMTEELEADRARYAALEVRRLEPSTNGFVYCQVCEQPQLVAGHECRSGADCTKRAAAVALWIAEVDLEIDAERNHSESQSIELDRLTIQLDAIREGLDEWAPVGEETLVDAVIRLRHAYEALALAARR